MKENLRILKDEAPSYNGAFFDASIFTSDERFGCCEQG